MFDSLGIMFEKCLMIFPTGKIMPCLIHFDSQSYDPSLIVLSVLSSTAREIDLQFRTAFAAEHIFAEYTSG